MKRNDFLKFLPAMAALGSINPVMANESAANPRPPASRDTRAYWVSIMSKLADPILINLSKKTLKKELPYEGRIANRVAVTYLEAFGRLLAGMAPWLELGADNTAEGKIRKKYIDLVIKSIDSATDPLSPDYMDFSKKVAAQPLVDAAFLAHGLLRGYNQLWVPLADNVKANVIAALKETRTIKPGNSNWVLFSAMVEAFLLKVNAGPEETAITSAIAKLKDWYKGDGHYGDGPSFHADYYNSFVMHPMLLDVYQIMKEAGKETEEGYNLAVTRARRYAAVQERMISPEGTFPVMGRSLAYRFGVFQLLGQIALMKQLPKEVVPAQVRSALSAVIARMIEAPGTFDAKGWLLLGFCGHQKSIAEDYISTGSVYLCTVGLLPLGLPANDEFWTAPTTDWTSKKAWSGVDIPADHAINQ